MARRKKTTSLVPGAIDNRERLDALGAVASEFEDWRPQAEVLRHVEAVPTTFIQYDRATGVGGHPIGRFTLTHGPSNEGKTAFCLGIGRSFLARGHFFGMVDAERTTPQPWVREMVGSFADHPGFVALPARSFEQIRKGVRGLCDRVASAREKGKLPPDTTGVVVVDSIRKLVPEKLWKNLVASLKEDGRKKDMGIDGFGGRAGQLKAALNAAWVDELIPLLADTRMAMVVVARETKEDIPSSSLFAPTRDWKTGGGSALFYEASLDVRVTRDWVYEGEKKEKRLVGERCCLEIHKTKVAGKTDKVPKAYFHTSNGVVSPIGFDPARDILELGVELGVVEQRGSSYRVGGETLGQGKAKALARLRDPAWMMNVEAEVRRAFARRGR